MTASAMITDEADPDAFIICGAALDSSLEDEIRITVIATGLGGVGGREDAAKQATQAQKQAEKAAADSAPVDPIKDEVLDGDDFADIMQILKKNRS